MDLSQCKRSMGLSLLLVGSLALVACGGDSDTPDAGGMNKDGTVSTADTGMPGADGGTADTGNPGQDGGPTADGGGMDGGGRDGGGRDGGNACTHGTCAELCSVTSTAPNHGCTAPNLFCNPGGSGLVITSSQTGMQEGVGACAATRIGIGSVCSQRDSTKSCDTSSTAGQLFCVGVPDVSPGTGFCFEFCDRTGAQANVCRSSDPGAGHYTCVDALGDPMAGVCSAECEEFPDTCSGRGALGAGTVCHGFQFGADPGMPQPPPFSSCLDVQTPTLRETKFKVNGTQIGAIPNSGDDCSGSNGEGFRCPDGTNCISPQAGVNICVRQCSTSTVPPLFPRGGCGLNAPTSTSAICFLGPGATDTNSLCAEP